MPNKDEPLIQVVDQNDQPLRFATKKEVWASGERHRIVWVIVKNRENKILLQKRSKELALYPNCWDVSVGGHVDAGETWEAAASREAEEELGLKDSELKEVGKFYYEDRFQGRKLNRFYRVYTISVDVSSVHYNQDEVSDTRWFTKDELKNLAEDATQKKTEAITLLMDKKLL